MNPENYKPFDVPVPWRLKRRPVYRGFPVPYLVMWFDGVPDFRVSDLKRWDEITRKKLCGLCGMKLGTWKWFVGGPKSVRDCLYYDPPSHEECVMYAAKVCPYLAMVRGYSFRPVDAPGRTIKHVHAVDDKPVEKIGLVRTSLYRVEQVGPDRLIRSGRPAEIVWLEA